MNLDMSALLRSKGIWGCAIILIGWLNQKLPIMDISILIGNTGYPLEDVTSLIGAGLALAGRLSAKAPLLRKEDNGTQA